MTECRDARGESSTRMPRGIIGSGSSTLAKLSDVNVNVSNRTPRQPFRKFPDRWLVCENDIARRLSAISSWPVNSRYQGSAAYRCSIIRRDENGREKIRVNTDLYLRCLRSDMEWQP